MWSVLGRLICKVDRSAHGHLTFLTLSRRQEGGVVRSDYGDYCTCTDHSRGVILLTEHTRRMAVVTMYRITGTLNSLEQRSSQGVHAGAVKNRSRTLSVFVVRKSITDSTTVHVYRTRH